MRKRGISFNRWPETIAIRSWEGEIIMTLKRMFVTFGVVLAVTLSVVSIAGNSQPQNWGTDFEALARKLVVQCAGIREDDLVLISGGVRDMELLENIAVNVRKQGAFPLITISSDRMTRRMFTDVPVKYDSQTPKFDLKLLDLITSVITVDYGETIGLLADIPPERLAAVSKASEPVGSLYVQRNIRGVNLGNGLYPTAALAKQ